MASFRQVQVHSPAEQLRQALEAERAGQNDAARRLALHLGSQELPSPMLNSVGSLLMRLNASGDAAEIFARVRRLNPQDPEYAINHAIALTSAGRGSEALRILHPLEQRLAPQARYWSVRGNAARHAGALEDARGSYQRALGCDASYKKAQQGLAQVALERGEPHAADLFHAALRTDGTSPYLWRGLAEALDMAGKRDDALALAWQIAKLAPQWTEGLETLAQLRLAAGEADYSNHYEHSIALYPDDPAIPAAWIAVLAGLDEYKRAADVASRAAARFPRMPQFKLLEAIHAGNAGDNARSERLFSELTLATSERFLHEARHHIRCGRFDAAGRALERVLADDPWNVSAWALQDLTWRAVADPRHAWLHGQDGLVRELQLAGGADLLDEAAAKLRELHARAALPLNQSLRGGTQTRGSLFDRHEPVFGRLRQAIKATVAEYQRLLPAVDARHPLLRHQDTAWRFAGSWSVRLTGGGDHHTAHIHPQGVVSSALYLIVPDRRLGEAQLELGRPPPDLRLDLSPLHVIKPAPGMLALFPSTLYHGTTPFRKAERITVAFDVVACESGAT